MSELHPDSVLRLQPRRVLQRDEAGPGGRVALRMFYGEREVTFEDDDLAFGRGLVRQSRFRAADACAWSDGAPRPWAEVRAPLTELVSSGILELDGHPAPPPDVPRTVLQQTPARGPMPPLRWHTLADLCALTGRDGRALPIDALEATLGAGLLAQLVRDTTGRQSGENSLAMMVPALTDPVPTDWRRCPFSGSRFDNARPMNVSGMKQLASDFDGMLGRIAQLRTIFLGRFGGDTLGLGGLWLLAWTCFVAPAWTARRAAGRCPNGSVPEWATAFSKTFGGIRMTLHHLLTRDGRGIETTISPAEFVRVTEESAAYISHAGVCAGTPQMIDRTLDVLLTGAAAPSAPSIEDIDGLVEYGLSTAALLLVATMRDARARLLAGEAALESESIARELADLDERDGDASAALQRAAELASLVGVVVDPDSPPLAAEVPSQHPGAGVLLAILGVEAEAVRLAAVHQARVNHALGVAAPPAITRSAVALGLATTPRQLWGDRVAAHLGWAIEDEGGALRITRRSAV